MKMVVALCALIGVITVAATLVVGHKTPTNATAEYGERLVAHTQQYLGPDAPDPQMRFTVSRRACASCHIGAGSEPGELSLIAAIGGHPNDIVDRINGCMVRNMDGRPLPPDGPEMMAIISWLRFLAGENAAMGTGHGQSHDPPVFRTPDRAANPEAGEQLFIKRCADCHGKNGAGLPASRNLAQGYLFPPLWGPDSFTDGSEMRNVPVAARFIKAKMPLGRPDLDDEQALDIAAFINSKPRPHLQ